MNSTVTRLDQMLYAWLGERDNRRFERAFEKYYEAAFTSLVKYLARRTNSPALDFEQIAVDALLKFFCRAGRERREASELIMNTLPQIHPLELGPYHVRQVRRWTTDIGTFRETAMSFSLGPEEDGARDWKAEIQSLTEKIPPLQRQGCHILEPIRNAIPAAADLESPELEAEEANYARIREFAVRLRGNAIEDAAISAEVERRFPGAALFVDGAWAVVESLPLLRVPTNGYLFDIAQSLYLDECKSRGRQKRGGTGTFSTLPASPDVEPPVGAMHPLALLSLDEDQSQPGERNGASSTPTAMVLAIDWVESPIDLESERIGEDFCEQFYAYLRRPLDMAEEAYQIAAANGPAKAERKRLDSLTRKTDRVISVLSMRIEGLTQEAIAEALGISRNQVKYIVELMQEAHAQFAAACSRPLLRQSTSGAISHVQ